MGLYVHIVALVFSNCNESKIIYVFISFGLGYAGFYNVMLGLGRFCFVELGTCVMIFIG